MGVDNNSDDVSITNITSEANGRISMAGSNNAPTRLPMSRLSLGQVLRNQLEHRRREALAAQAQTKTSNTTQAPDRYYTEVFGHGMTPNIAGSRGPNYYGLHTASWNTGMRELAAPQDEVSQAN